MSLTPRDTRTLFRAGFTRNEIAELGSATDPLGNPQPAIDLTSPAWIAALEHRRLFTVRVQAEYRVTHKDKLMPRQVHNRIIDQWYGKGRGRTVWDWLKITYKPKKKIDFIKAAKRRAQVRERSLREEFRRR